jgi:hypothetical protein
MGLCNEQDRFGVRVPLIPAVSASSPAKERGRPPPIYARRGLSAAGEPSAADGDRGLRDFPRSRTRADLFGAA